MYRKLIGWPLLAFALTACVTINIYFPAAEAEEAARTIVRDVLGSEPAVKPEADLPQGDKGSDVRRESVLLMLVGRGLELLVPTAQAGQANININTPAIDRLRSAMSRRQAQLAGYYRSGALGFDQGGLVAIHDMGAVSLAQRNQMKKLMADENNDRNALYREIARANGHPEWEQEVRSTFAKVWIEEAPRGYWYQRGGSWVQK